MVFLIGTYGAREITTKNPNLLLHISPGLQLFFPQTGINTSQLLIIATVG